MFASAILSTILLASSVLAAPHRSPLNLLHGLKGSTPTVATYGTASEEKASNVVYDNIWAGAVLEDANGTFTSVTGTFTVPTPKGSGSSAIWVGLDGIGCQVILQTGVDATITNGTLSYSSWYEWYPDPSHVFPPSNISFSPNDTVTLTATSHTPTAGTVTITNLSTNQTVSQAVNSTSALCQQNAEWIVEDYAAGGIVRFDDFGTVTFTDAEATAKNGSTVGPEDAAIYEIQQNGTTLATASVQGKAVVVKHT